MNSIEDIQRFLSVLEIEIKKLEKQLNENDKNILKILKRINTKEYYPVLNQVQDDVGIRIRSYTDGDT